MYIIILNYFGTFFYFPQGVGRRQMLYYLESHHFELLRAAQESGQQDHHQSQLSEPVQRWVAHQADR